MDKENWHTKGLNPTFKYSASQTFNGKFDTLVRYKVLIPLANIVQFRLRKDYLFLYLTSLNSTLKYSAMQTNPQPKYK